MVDISKIISEFIEVSAIVGVNDDAFLEALIRADSLDLRYKFENGLASLLCEIEDYATKESISNTDLSERSISNRIENLIKNKLLCYCRFKDYRGFLKNRRWFWCKNPVSALKQTYKISDDFWCAVERAHTDFSFYTKRATLIMIYNITLCKFINDYSYEFTDTFKFLNNRIKNIVEFTMFKNRLKPKRQP